MSGQRKREAALRKYQVLKGRIAESLVEELMATLGFEVRRVGQEHLLPPLAIEALRGAERVSAIRAVQGLPDFWVQARAKDLGAFVEVKYRANGEVPLKTLERCSVLVERGGVFVLLSRSTGTPEAPAGFIRACTYKEAVEKAEGRATVHMELLPMLRNCTHFGTLNDVQRSDVDALAYLVHTFFDQLPLEKTLLPGLASARERHKGDSHQRKASAE